MEAMASGLPVVCSKIRGNVDLIKNGKGGVLINPSNISEIADSIRDILMNGNIMNEMSNFNRREISEFNVRNVLSGYERIVKNLSEVTYEKICNTAIK